MQTPKDILKQYDIRPRKRFSQSFLTDINTIKKIVRASAIDSKDVVLEIGAGIGVLTREMGQRAQTLIAVEIDENLVPVLQKQLSDCPSVIIENQDVLKFDISSISKRYNLKIKVVGNVPYHISSPLIFHLLRHRSAIDGFLLMLQEEVVDRLVSKPDCKQYGVPSVLLQMFADVEKLFTVSAECFSPRPKVASAIMRGKFLAEPVCELDNEQFFFALVKASFAQRRKMLINNLKQAKILEGLSQQEILASLNLAGIDGKRRGETLSVSEFGQLSNVLNKDLAKRN